MHSCSSARAQKFVPAALWGDTERSLPLKVNYSCIGIKLCDGPALVKLRYVFLSGYSFSVYNVFYIFQPIAVFYL